MTFWKEVKWVACELKERLVSWRGYSGICERVSDYWWSGVSLSGSRCRREVVVGGFGTVYDCCVLQCQVW